MSAPTSTAGMTLGQLKMFLAPDTSSNDLMAWPPDAFAIAASALALSGGYLRVTRDWPPTLQRELQSVWESTPPHARGLTMSPWRWAMRLVGLEWAQFVSAPRTLEDQSPSRILKASVERWLRTIETHGDTPLTSLLDRGNEPVEALLQIVAAADEACVGAGLITGKQPGTLLDRCNRALLAGGAGATLCQRVRREIALVLPKAHTPQYGATIRSLTHNLALCPTTEVTPRWLLSASDFRPRVAKNPPDASADFGGGEPGLNLLVVPWPRRVTPAHFKAVRPGTLGQGGYFDFECDRAAADPATQEAALRALCQAAREQVGRIDGVVLPELAVPADNVELLARSFLKENKSGIFIAGVGTPGLYGKPGRNEACFGFTVGPLTQIVRQSKHHRWCLDRGQIEAYGLGGRLDPTVRWWENIELDRRELAFMPFLPSITAAVLICEDLARQEPASQIIRAVGPNLVVALLMDGPQLSNRWSGRYAAVLADDPGSSVLSVTSLGMTELCRPGGIPAKRTIGLWKDQLNGVREINLEPGAEAVVLSLTHDLRTEYTLDGRSDDGTANFLALNGVHPIFLRT